VCDSHLHAGQAGGIPPALQLFCAQTLRRKLQKDFEELPAGSVSSLRNSILRLLHVYDQASSAVRIQLAIALAALAVHMDPSSDWDGYPIITWICHQLAPNMLSDGFGSQRTETTGVSAHQGDSSGGLSSSYNSLLNVMLVLPEEARRGRIAVRPQRRREVLHHLSSSVPSALTTVWSCCTRFNDSETSIKSNVLKAVAEWIHLDVSQNAPDTCVRANHVTNSGLLQLALSGLHSDELFDASVETVSELIGLTKRAGNSSRSQDGASGNGMPTSAPSAHVSHADKLISDEMAPLAQRLVEEVMRLRTQFSKAIGSEREAFAHLDNSSGSLNPARPSEIARIGTESPDDTLDFEDARGIAQLFADVGESYIELITRKEDEAVAPMEAMLQVMAHRDFQIAELSFHFWRELAAHVGVSWSWEQEQRRRARFGPPFQRIFELVKAKVLYPDDFDTRGKNGQEDFYSERGACIDLLQDAAAVIGTSQAMMQLAHPMQLADGKPQCNTSADLLDIEATLFCIKAIAPGMPEADGTLPNVIKALRTLPYDYRLASTCCRLIESYAQWFVDAYQFSGDLVEPSAVVLFNNCIKSDRVVRMDAMAAISTLSEKCTVQMTQYLESIIHAFQHLHQRHVDCHEDCVEEILDLIQSASVIGASMQNEKRHRVAEAICDPLQKDLERETHAEQGMREEAVKVYADFVSEFFRYYADRRVVAEVFGKLWPVLSKALNLCSTESGSEHVCRALKYGVRNSREDCESMLMQMLQQVDRLFSERLHSPFLYLSAEILRVFATREDLRESLLSFLLSLLNTASSALSTLDNFNSAPYIADDLFLLLNKLLHTNPTMLYSEQMLQPLLDLAITGMHVEQPDASQSLMNFLRSLLRTRQQQEMKALESIIVPRGQWLAASIVQGIAGRVPRSRLEELAEVLHALMSLAGASAFQWTLTTVSAIPASVATDGEHSAKLKEEAHTSTIASINSERIFSFYPFLPCSRQRVLHAGDGQGFKSACA